ncbi:MAG: hypothetical protein FWE49_01910 [Synergistaceae bacterium]|nr:hypothetical protein [Synergistaceae bacterium]
MSSSRFMKFLLVALLMFSFVVPGHAEPFAPGNFIIHDDVLDAESRKEYATRMGLGSESGPWVGITPALAVPTTPFGRAQGANTPSTANFPESMRLGMEYFTFGTNVYESEVAQWFTSPAFRYVNVDYSDSSVHVPFVSERLHTRNEDLRGYTAYYTTNKEMNDWFDSLSKLPGSNMKYQLVTGFPFFSGTGGTAGYNLERTFELVVGVLSKGGVAFTPEEVRDLGKPVVWLHGQIHGNETSPGEALLQLAADLARGWTRDGVDFGAILDKVTVVIVPRFNIDGAYAWNRASTGAAPSGNAGQGSSGIDMNRDFVGFETPLVRAVRQLNIAYDPIVSFCGHEMGYTWDSEQTRNTATGTAYTSNGYRRGYQPAMTTTFTFNLNVDKRVRDLGQYLYEPATRKLLEDKKVGWAWYIGGSAGGTQYVDLDEVVASNGTTLSPYGGRLTYTQAHSDFALVPEEGIGINGVGLGNQSLVFVHEAANAEHGNTVRLNYLRRTYAHYLGALAICQTAANHRDVIMDAIYGAREDEIARTRPLSFWGQTPATEDDSRQVIEFGDWRKATTDEVIQGVRYGSRPVRGIRARGSVVNSNDTRSWVDRPVAYVIPAQYYEAAIRLYYTGAKLERLAYDTTLEVEAYTVTGTGAANQSTSGTTSQISTAIRTYTKATKDVNFPKDSFVVRMDQLGASLAGLALEPGAIRNYGNYYLSRTRGATGNTSYIPANYRDTFIPAVLNQEFPVYRYMGTELPDTYPANLNVPFMLTMVEKVHSPTLEELKLIKDKLGYANLPEYVSKLELPVLAARDYKNTPNHLITEAFLLPNGEAVDLNGFVTDNRVTIVAPAGFENGRLYLAKSVGEGDFDLVKVNEGPLDDVYAEAFVVKDKNGNMNTLTIVVWKVYREGSGYYEELAGEKDFRIGNNVASNYDVGGYKVYVKTTGRDKIEKCYVVKN